MGSTILIAQYSNCPPSGRNSPNHQHNTDSVRMLAVFYRTAIFFTPTVLSLLQTPPGAFSALHSAMSESAPAALFYLWIYNAISAILRGLGDSKNPIKFVAIACGVISSLTLPLLEESKWELPGLHCNHSVSGNSVCCQNLLLQKNNFIFTFSLQNFRIYPDEVPFNSSGTSVSLQETMVSLSFLVINAIVNSLGVVASAAVGICAKFESFAMLPAGAFSSAIASMSAQNMGAQKPQRVKKCMWTGIAFAFLCSLFFFFLRDCCRCFFALSKQMNKVWLLALNIWWTFSFDFMFVFSCMNGLNGCGCTTFTMATALLQLSW